MAALWRCLAYFYRWGQHSQPNRIRTWAERFSVGAATQGIASLIGRRVGSFPGGPAHRTKAATVQSADGINPGHQLP